MTVLYTIVPAKHTRVGKTFTHACTCSVGLLLNFCLLALYSNKLYHSHTLSVCGVYYCFTCPATCMYIYYCLAHHNIIGTE